jgi:DNA-binding NarL/FixJ family response regulator
MIVMTSQRRRRAPDARPPRVLIVDDSAPVRAYLAGLLEREFTVAGVVSDAESLLHGWTTWRPDVIVLDISLPGLSGLEAAARLRKDECDAPIVFLSVHVDPEIVLAAWGAGGTAYVAKGDVGRDLLPAIHAVLGGRRFASAAIDPASWGSGGMS